MLFDEKVQKFN